jgi:uncharacterized protein YjbI with pentapeptide repeats|nr:MAG TPA: hypothetical protein [Caudoviricetes sp.]
MYQFDRNYAEAKLTIGAVEFTSSEYSIETIKITNGCYDGNAVGVGSVYIRHAEVTMERIRAVQKGTPISISFKVNDLWRGHGEYYVKEVPVVNGDKMTLQLQGILSKFEDIELVFSGGKQTYTLNDMKEQVESITGCQVVFLPPLSTEEKSTFLGRECCFLKDISTFVNGSDEATGVNVRSALSGLATLFGGNVYEEHGYIYIKSKTFHAADPSVISKDDISGDYSFSQLTYAVRSLNLSFLPWSITGMFNPPNTSSRIFTTGYQGNERVSNLLLGSQITDHTLYDYTIECDWLGWTSDGSKFDHYMTPGGRISACLRQGDLVYKSGTFNIIGYEITGQIKPGNIIKFEVQEETDPISIYCGEVTLEWDGGFKTTVSCNCNIEEGTASSSSGNSSALIRAAEQEAKINLYKLKFADIELSNIKDSTISGSIFKDGTIDGSKIKDSTITGSLIADSTIKGSNIEEGTITGSKIKAATITGALIVDGTIRGNHIMESSIDGSKIEDSAITESKISNSSITNSKIKDGEIENAKIKDSTLTGAKIKDATIGFEKVDSSFIKDLTADKAYIENLTARVGDFGYLTADEANIKYATIASLEVVDGKIDNLETIAITTNNLSAKVADLGYLKADKADLKYANIELSNIDVANVGTFFANVGLIDRATIVNGHVTGFLDSVEVNANKITAGTLVADRILLKGSEKGVLYALNNLGELTSTTVDTLDGYILTDRTINADKIVASSITANELDVDNIFSDSAVITKIFAQDITATGIIRGATLVGASVSADRGTIGGFGIFDDCLTGFYDEDGYQYKVDLNTAKSITGKNGGVIAIEAGKYKISSPYNTEHEWYVTYDGYMYAEIGEIAGFILKDKKLISNSEYTSKNNGATFYYDATINSKFNQEEDFLSLTCTVNDTEINKAFLGFDGVRLESLNHGDDYYDKWMNLETRSLAFGVNSGTPYNGSSIAFEIDSGYSEITSSGEFTIEPSCTINVPTTAKSLTIKNNGSKGKTVISNGLIGLDDAQGGTVRYFIDNTYGNLRIWDTAVGERLLISPTSINFKPDGKTILSVNKDNASENGYELIGCEVTTSGNFTCKKYRDGRLVIEYRFKTTSNVSLSNKIETYYATGPAATFPVAFTDVPSVISGLGIANLQAPFCNVTFESVTKTGFGRYIIWTLPTISGYVIPSGSVVSATFTGRWK